MASILLLQNDPVVGEALRKAIAAEAGLRVAAVAGSLAQARQHLAQGGIDLLVADLRIGDERLTDLLRERRERGLAGRPQVLVVAMSVDDPNLMQAVRQGADGYFIHGSPMKALAGVIRQVLAGESPMSASIARRLQAHFRLSDRVIAEGEPGLAPSAPSLTETERQMLNRVCQGYLLHEIARELRTSEHSVGLRSRSLYRKLQLDLRASAELRQAA
jgi:DNA-binding NarL/FixJ family response regulator